MRPTDLKPWTLKFTCLNSIKLLNNLWIRLKIEYHDLINTDNTMILPSRSMLLCETTFAAKEIPNNKIK